MNIGNAIRTHLITKFACAKCGELLKIGDLPERAPANNDCGEGFTGAEISRQFIAIEPCRTCNKPAEQITAAMKVLMDAVQKNGASE